MRFAMALMAGSLLAGSAEAATVMDWPTKCAIFRTVLAWAADNTAYLPDPRLGGAFKRSPNDVFDGLPPGLADRVGTPTPNLTDYLPWPNKNCRTQDFRQPGLNLFFGEPQIDQDFSAVDLQQSEITGPYGGGASNMTRFVLQKKDGQWRVLTALTYSSGRAPPIQIGWSRGKGS